MGARETGALKEAKDKLQKRVEELTWRILLEKRLKTDLEYAKNLEIAKLHEALQALQAMQLQLQEAKAMAIKEREAARKAIEEAPPIIKETHVIVEDTEKTNSLNNVLEKMRAALQLETVSKEEVTRVDAAVCIKNEELQKNLEDEKKKSGQYQETMQKLAFSDGFFVCMAWEFCVIDRYIVCNRS